MDVVGHIDALQLNYYAITLQRKLTHPAVAAISEAAQDSLVGATMRAPLPDVQEVQSESA